MSIPPVLWGEFLVNTNKYGIQSDVELQALDNGKFLAVWKELVPINYVLPGGDAPTPTAIYAQRFYSGAVPEGDPIRIDTTPGINSAPTVTTLENGKIVYMWEHQVTEGGVTTYSIRARIFNGDGTPFNANGGTEDFEVVAPSTTKVSAPLVKALAGGGFIVTCNDENADGAGDAGVKAYIYDSSGQVIDSGSVNRTTTGTQEAYAVVSLSDNRFLTIYSEDAASGGVISLKVSISTVSGGVLSTGVTEYTVSASMKEGTAPSATVLKGGRILIVWTEEMRDGTGDNVKAQMFDGGTMTAIGDAFTVNVSADGDQNSPSVTALKDGGFAITYLDTDGTAAPQVRVAVYNAANVYLGDKIISTAFDEGERGVPKVIELSDGRLIAAWDENIDGRRDDSVGIRGQVIDARFQGVNMPGTAANDQYVGTEFNDTLSGGTAGNDDLNGRAGNDILDGGIGDDRLNGGEGADQMYGGTGNDTYYVDNAGDVVSEAGGSGIDTVYASISYTLSADIENLIADGLAAISLTGNAGNNSITGNAAANVIDGAGGADTMSGGLGNDTYYVDNAGDIIIEAGGDLADQVFTSVTYALGDGVENLTASGAGSIGLTGNAFNNVIVGNSGANKIYGGLGNDILTGGKGKDVFVFDSAPNKAANRDTITDFEVKADKIHLENAIFKKLKKTGKLKSDFFKIGTKATDKNDYIIYNKKKGILLYDADGSGKQKAVEFATVKKNLALKADHFFVI
ncbi:calcium-binding protein [Microvirga guangxiensis]|uniref:Hemolysin-type calcium-binding repeat-containing protein n=1 Tax=Microvirga guangxiensis TaxID=549386 RepID=A0A1G5C985_9HYPH|nr:calcium-binding protein [Microvirga guangxiensis]SCX98868.1 Hemolysin-type calcium-binding repeat-containing protein [Microvirga guangxiensis]